MRCLATLTIVLALASVLATGDDVPPPGSAGTLRARSRDNAVSAKTAMQSEESELAVTDVSGTPEYRLLDTLDMLTLLSKVQAALPGIEARNIDGQMERKEKLNSDYSAFSNYLHASFSPDLGPLDEPSNSTLSASSKKSAEASPKPDEMLPNSSGPSASGPFMVFNEFPVDLGAAREFRRPSGDQSSVIFMTFNGFPVVLGASRERMDDSGAESAVNVSAASNAPFDKKQ